MYKLKKNAIGGFTAVEAAIVILALSVVALAAFYVENQVANKAATSKVSSSTTSIDGVKVEYIDMPGLADYKAGHIPGVAEAAANYIYGYEDPRSFCEGCAEPYWGSGKVVYDGNTVYSGELDSESVALSDNGLHYAYAVPGSMDNEKFYVDKRYLPESKDMTVGSAVYAVSNSGKDYGWDTQNDVYVDSTLRYSIPTSESTTMQLDSTLYSATLSDFLTTMISADASNAVAIIYDGKVLSSFADTNPNSSLNDAISPNGQHYMYSTNNAIFVDRKNVASLNQADVNSDGVVTDNGDYAYVIAKPNGSCEVIVNGATHPTGQCPQNDTEDDTAVTVSDDGANYFYSLPKNNTGVLNGKSVRLTGTVENAQFFGDTLYVYRWVS